MADFYIDNDVSVMLADALYQVGHNAVTTRDLNLTGATDAEQFLVASRRHRIFVTHNRTDYELLHDAWGRWSKEWNVIVSHCGITVIPQRRAYGIDWTPERIAKELDNLVRQCPNLTNKLLRRSGEGWLEWGEKVWRLLPIQPLSAF